LAETSDEPSAETAIALEASSPSSREASACDC
jgi:hypothetical protein